jgi:hypothetical protein
MKQKLINIALYLGELFAATGIVFAALPKDKAAVIICYAVLTACHILQSVYIPRRDYLTPIYRTGVNLAGLSAVLYVYFGWNFWILTEADIVGCIVYAVLRNFVMIPQEKRIVSLTAEINTLKLEIAELELQLNSLRHRN